MNLYIYNTQKSLYGAYYVMVINSSSLDNTIKSSKIYGTWQEKSERKEKESDEL